MKLGIVTDSTSDLPPYLVEQYELEVVPAILILEGREFTDGIGISREDFYRRLNTLQQIVSEWIILFLLPFTLLDSKL